MADYGEYLRQLFLKGQGKITQGRGPAAPSVRKFYSYHPGYDIAVPEGTPIYAPFKGKTTFSGISGGYGQRLGIYDPEANKTYYLSHLSSVKAPSQFNVGDLLAYTGGTPGKPYSGQSTGAHIDIETAIGKVVQQTANQVVRVAQNTFQTLLKKVLAKYPEARAVGRAGDERILELAKKYGGKVVRVNV